MDEMMLEDKFTTKENFKMSKAGLLEIMHFDICVLETKMRECLGEDFKSKDDMFEAWELLQMRKKLVLNSKYDVSDWKRDLYALEAYYWKKYSIDIDQTV